MNRVRSVSFAWVIFLLLPAISLGVYLLASARVYGLGFPLDDAWIHQTYARNLAERGEWSFLPGQPSAGSTAPLWSALLAAGHLIGLPTTLWAYLLGWGLLSGLAAVGSAAQRALLPGRPNWGLGAGALLALEWHLVWAAGSGMETLLFGLLVLAVLAWLAAGKVNWLGLGLVVGLSAWVRPDGITLLGPAGLALWLGDGDLRRRGVNSVRLLLGAALLFVPYLAFNRVLAGAWWPNTFFAKQAEYAVLRQLPLFERFMEQASLPMVGVGALLLPGFILMVVRAVRSRAWGPLAGAAWLAGYLFLYAWRLPVTYQHGRYIIPAMAVFFVWGLAGLAGWIEPAGRVLWRRVVSRAWLVASGLVLVLFWLQGAAAYGRDVAIIESEMVAAARWVAANTPPEAQIAAHDIGALGYYARRPLLDLAGLVSPEVIPFIRDEGQLAAFLDRSGAEYLVTFPGWYPQLVQRGAPVYTTGGVVSPQQGGENMTVYRWGKP